jgi:arginyl-tRNA--protein-N-Asp/Glu arginylyltransferase
MATAAGTAAAASSSSPSSSPEDPRSGRGLTVNRIRIFGSTWSECGYCKGARSALAVRSPIAAAADDISAAEERAPAEAQEHHASAQPSSNASDIVRLEERERSSSSRAYTVLATHLEAQVYEALIERGWRRSGRALYKPDNARSCCPAITIRLAPSAFVPTKHQRKLVNQVRRRLQLECSQHGGDTAAAAAAIRRNDHDHANDVNGRDRDRMMVDAKPQSSPERGRSPDGGTATSNGQPRPPKKGRSSHPSAASAAASSTLFDATTVQSPTTPQLLTSSSNSVALHSSIVSSGLQPGFVVTLQDATLESIRSILRSGPSGTLVDDDATSALLSVPVQYKVVKTAAAATAAKSKEPVVSPEHKPRQRAVTLSSSVCAAIVGRMTAERKKQNDASPAHPTSATPAPNRGELAEQLARELERRFVTESSSCAGTSCRVDTVEAHAPSGQVLVHLRVDDSFVSSAAAAPIAATTLNSPAILTPSQNGDNVPPNQTADSTDKVAQWWRKSVVLHEQQQQSSPAAFASAASVRWSFLSREGTVLPEPPYEIRVTTLPAHQSALDPAVHLLYVEYQHAVHGDADPFASIPAGAVQDAGSTNSIVHNGTVHGPSTVGTSDKLMMDVSGNELEGDEEGQDEEDADGRGSDDGTLYKWADLAPAGWKARAQTMLQLAYPRAMSRPRYRRQLVSSFGGFYEFLVENPFDSSSEASHVASAHMNGGANSNGNSSMNSNVPLEPGTYHQHYRLGNVLIAVGVVDVLPSGLSSVYLFYDPVFARDVIPMGKYAILKEIEYTRDSLRLPYYYLGYYIESCPKMRYKIEYRPSELLCPVTYRWVEAEQGKQTLLRNSPQRHYCQLYLEDSATGSSQAHLRSTSSSQAAVLDTIVLDVGAGFPVTLNHLQPRGRAFLEPILAEFVAEAGIRVAPRCTIAFR